MRYLSVCSGIEAASVAWCLLGWEPLAFSEIEPFPRAVLTYHFPNVILYGDFTKLRDEPWVADADVLVGGTPCQSFSVAGLRGSLSDERGNLALEFVRLANAIDDLRRDAGRAPAFILWENVPGVLSTKDNAFGCFLAGLVGSDTAVSPGKGRRWPDAGVVSGPRRVAAWRCLDAQFYGLAQRRKRLFVLAREHPGGWACADALLPVIDSLSWHPAPRREARESVAPTISARPTAGGGLGTDFDLDGGLIANTLSAARGASCAHAADLEAYVPVVFGGGNTSGPIDLATACNGHGIPHGRLDFDSETFVAYSLRADVEALGADSAGRGASAVPLAFSCKDYGADAGAIAPTLRAMGYDGSHANAGGQVAVAFDLRGREGGAMPEGPYDTANIRAASGGLSRSYVALHENQRAECALNETAGSLKAGGRKPGQGYSAAFNDTLVRRLTPRECERLQGFPDDFTRIPWRGRPADGCPDGPRYKALGNSMAVPVIRWIGERIEAFAEKGQG